MIGPAIGAYHLSGPPGDNEGTNGVGPTPGRVSRRSRAERKRHGPPAVPAPTDVDDDDEEVTGWVYGPRVRGGVNR